MTIQAQNERSDMQLSVFGQVGDMNESTHRVSSPRTVKSAIEFNEHSSPTTIATTLVNFAVLNERLEFILTIVNGWSPVNTSLQAWKRSKIP